MNEFNFYEEFFSENIPEEDAQKKIEIRKFMRSFYFDFFKNFRDYLGEYIRENVNETEISGITIGQEPIVLFRDVLKGTRVYVKNQGYSQCILTTNGQTGYCLDPSERIEIYVNEPIIATTVSGETELGIVQY